MSNEKAGENALHFIIQRSLIGVRCFRMGREYRTRNTECRITKAGEDIPTSLFRS